MREFQCLCFLSSSSFFADCSSSCRICASKISILSLAGRILNDLLFSNSALKLLQLNCSFFTVDFTSSRSSARASLSKYIESGTTRQCNKPYRVLLVGPSLSLLFPLPVFKQFHTPIVLLHSSPPVLLPMPLLCLQSES